MYERCLCEGHGAYVRAVQGIQAEMHGDQLICLAGGFGLGDSCRKDFLHIVRTYNIAQLEQIECT